VIVVEVALNPRGLNSRTTNSSKGARLPAGFAGDELRSLRERPALRWKNVIQRQAISNTRVPCFDTRFEAEEWAIGV
jgi:hypothetical protein